ncbi:MAG TPA: UDP-N-acetylmuramoyl-L-alanyl-D-glutamate--2,6-diaminopimelate ligase [Acidimicrobiales bacterium]|nr:UDP-N-acetylmuramoyl-L-alanyl-D-glutamate--2,6-diaminopimelate ligase [Acidimicrobiales bacterium]
MELTRLVAESAGLSVSHAAGDINGVEVTSIAYDSRAVQPGALYVCVPGHVADGHDFAAAAVERGAVALIVEHELPIAVPQVVVDDARVAMALASAAFNGHPSSALTVVGVTGTNGKTTTVHFLEAIFRAHGWAVGVIGTLTGARTTPEAPDLQRQLAAWRDAGVDAVAMEVSSHALVLHRVDGTRFAVAVFTNLSRDHLDFHGTMERYFEAKARLFTPSFADRAVVNAEDPHGRLLLDAAQIPTVPYSIADVSDLRLAPSKSTFTWRGEHVRVPIGGRHNVVNALAAATAAAELGVAVPAISVGIGNAGPVPGRFEPIEEGQPFSVVVDYAHTPDGLERVLEAAREVAAGHRVVLVFGAGGDRDRTKRPAMGAAAGTGADVAILTSDNPRSEDPAAIIAEVARGAPADALVIEADRRRAIARAFATARPGDVVVIAGKGHESTQTIGDQVLPFDDRVVAREELSRMGEGR